MNFARVMCRTVFHKRFGALGSCWRSYGIKAKVLDSENLEVTTEKGHDFFPLIWLRDNCTCPKCFDKNTRSRVIDWNRFRTDVNIQNLKAVNNHLEITWNDNHHSVYTYEWLTEHSFTKENHEKYLSDVYRPPKKLWSKEEFNRALKCFDFNEVLTNDVIFYEWLMNLAIYGIVLIDNVPKNENECIKVVNRIGFPKTTHYGTEYHVKIKKDASNVAYIPKLLQMHTDLPFYRYKPSTIFLHCIEQTKTKGGENLLTDGFYVAEKLRIEHKDVFDTLTSISVNWFDEGVDEIQFSKVLRKPVISLNSKGKIESIHHNIARRDSHFTTDIKNVKKWYKALRTFVDMINEHASEFKLQPGQILAFDNTRLLHGRTSYIDTKDTKRFLVGIYVDWDEIYSKIRVLKKSLKK